MATIATAEVDVIANTSRFTSDLRRKLRAALAGSGGDIGADIIDALRGIGDQMGRQLEREISSRVVPRLSRAMERAGRDAAGGFTDGYDRSLGQVSRITTDALADLGTQAAIQGSRFGQESGDAFVAGYRDRIESNLAAAFETAQERLETTVPNIFDRTGRTAADAFSTGFERELRSEAEGLTTAALADVRTQAIIQSGRFGTDSADAFVGAYRSRLESSLTTSVQQAFARTEGQVSNIFARSGRSAADAFSEGFEDERSQIGSAFQDILDDIDSRTQRAAPGMRRAGAQLAQAFGEGAERARTDIAAGLVDPIEDAESRLRVVTRRIGGYFRDNIGRNADIASRAGRRLTDGILRLGRALTIAPLQNIGNLFTDFTQNMVSAAAAGVIIIGVLIQLSGLLFALPAALTVTAAAVTTVAIGFNGMGEAFAAAGRSAAEFEEAIEDLAPSAQRVAREFRSLRSGFDDLQLEAQEALFSELDGALTDIAENLGGAFRTGVVDASGALGRLLDGVADFLAEAETADTVAEAFEAVRAIFDAMADEIQPLLRGLRTITDEFLPRFRELEDVIDGIGDEFEEWAEAVTAPRDDLDGLSTAMDAFNRSIEFIEQVGRIIGNVFRVVAAIFTATADNGVNLLSTIEALTENLAELAESPEGQEALADFFDNLDRIIAQLLPLMSTLLGELGELAGPVADLLERVRPDIEEFFRNLGDGIREFLEGGGGDAIVELFESLSEIDFEQLGGQLGDILAFAAEILPFVVDVINFFIDLVGWIITGIEWIQLWAEVLSQIFENTGERLGDFADWWGEFWFGLAFQAIFEIVGLFDEIIEGWKNFWEGITGEGAIGIESVLGIFDGFGLELSGLWSGLWTGLRTSLGSFLGNISGDISGSISNWTGRFSGLQSTLSGIWSRMWAGLHSMTVGRLGQIFSTVSGRLGDLRGAFSGAVSAILGVFSTLASRIASMAATIRDQIGNIISAIQSIPSLPSAGSIFDFFADGGIVTGPTAALIGEAGPEVVIPLSRPSRAEDLARQSGLLDMLAGRGLLGDSTAPPGAPVVGEMHIHPANADPEQTARHVVRVVERRMRGRGLERVA